MRQGRRLNPVGFRVAIYARVSTHDQQTLPLQRSDRVQFNDPSGKGLLAAVRRRELDAIIVWRLDRWGRSLADLILTLKELT